MLFSCENSSESIEERLPNIILIMADDMGYGDLKCFNPESKIPTPNIDKLADEGMRFTDAHAPGTTCTPSRYGLLTGRYPFRNNRNYREGLIEPGRLTIAKLLQYGGYTTACIGKWHQGMINEKNPQPGADLQGNPTQHGFDYFFGLPASLDIPPYYYVENGQCVLPPTDTIEASNTPGISPIQGAFWRKGGIAPGYKHENVVDELKQKVVDYIGNHFQNKEKPLFLYFPLPSPHTPWLPNGENKGRTSIGDYGDYTAQVDDVVGEVIQTLKQTGQDQNTIVIFTSDNGPVWYPEDVEKYDHSSTGSLAGMKGDLWEGGHRMPFVVHWPGKTKPNSVNRNLVCFTDFMATFAEITGQEIPDNAGEDSFSFLTHLTGKESELPYRQNFVINVRKSFAISTGDWKYINIPGPGGFTERYLKGKDVKFEQPEQLYHLTNDLGETENLFNKNGEKAKELSELLSKIVANNK
jgi:arylsulfatase A-like enzyme